MSAQPHARTTPRASSPRQQRTPRTFLTLASGVCVASMALATLTAHGRSDVPQRKGWWQAGNRLVTMSRPQAASEALTAGQGQRVESVTQSIEDLFEGERLFDRETFDGNGRTCLTCHSRDTGTVSPADARARFRRNPNDPLFVHDGSDDDNGDGFGDGQHVTRMLQSATILMRIRLHDNVEVKDHPEIREITVRRGIPTTLNTPALDPVLMLDGRQPTLQDQAQGAITDHAQATRTVTSREKDLIATFQKTPRFYSSLEMLALAFTGRTPELPAGRTASEKRGRTFFEDLPPDFSVTPPNFKRGTCAACHSGPLMNQTNQFLPVAVPPGSRFQDVLVSAFNVAGNPVIDFIFRDQPNDLNPVTNQDGTPDGNIQVSSPDPGRALISGRADDNFVQLPTASFDHLNAFKISPLRGIRNTAPYFHDNSATTLEDVAEHYRKFFLVVTDVDGPGPAQPLIVLTEQDKADIVAFLKLLN
jgi:cytochrome c peroxidase